MMSFDHITVHLAKKDLTLQVEEVGKIGKFEEVYYSLDA